MNGEVHRTHRVISATPLATGTTGATRLTRHPRVDRVWTETLLEHLHELDEAPWAEYGSMQKPLTSRQLGDRFHDLRHGAISTWIRAGWSIERVQTEADHADPAFTIRVYGWMFPDEIEHGRAELDATTPASNKGIGLDQADLAPPTRVRGPPPARSLTGSRFAALPARSTLVECRRLTSASVCGRFVAPRPPFGSKLGGS